MGATAVLDSKTIGITGKRQITIPKKFFEFLGFGQEAECVLRDGELALRPKQSQDTGEFDEQILADLISEGYEGEKLLSEFKAARKRIRPAVRAMMDEAKHAARHPSEYDGYEDVFGSGDES